MYYLEQVKCQPDYSYSKTRFWEKSSCQCFAKTCCPEEYYPGIGSPHCSTDATLDTRSIYRVSMFDGGVDAMDVFGI